MLRIFFGRHAPTARLIQMVERVREERARVLKEFEAAEEEAPPEDRESPDFPYWTMSLRFGILVSEARLRWCDETLATLRALDRRNRGEEEGNGAESRPG